jgi:hypothetical protein
MKKRINYLKSDLYLLSHLALMETILRSGLTFFAVLDRNGGWSLVMQSRSSSRGIECEFQGRRLIAKYFTPAVMVLIYQQPAKEALQGADSWRKAALSWKNKKKREGRFYSTERSRSAVAARHLSVIRKEKNACCVSRRLPCFPMSSTSSEPIKCTQMQYLQSQGEEYYI